MVGSGTSTLPFYCERSLIGTTGEICRRHRLGWFGLASVLKFADLDHCATVMERNVLHLRSYAGKYLGVKECNVCNRFQMVQKNKLHISVYVHTHAHSTSTHCLRAQIWKNVNPYRWGPWVKGGGTSLHSSCNVGILVKLFQNSFILRNSAKKE